MTTPHVQVGSVSERSVVDVYGVSRSRTGYFVESLTAAQFFIVEVPTHNVAIRIAAELNRLALLRAFEPVQAQRSEGESK